jgi:DNA replication and repair protein RecF
VEHSFHGVWINYQRALRQRNACLRGTPRDSLRPWDREVAHWGEQVAKYQKAYVNSLQRSAAEYTEILLGAKGSTITLSYRGGWDMNAEDLLVALSARVEQDRHVGHTTCGPHRADVLLEYRGILAAQALSRGQQKLAVIALRLAQAQHLRDLTGRRSLFAIDDVPSELDQSHRRRLIELLCKLQAQIFLTATEPDLLDGFSTATTEMFHVEHGEIEPGC